jgi:ammonia channel protein AmtB
VTIILILPLTGDTKIQYLSGEFSSPNLQQLVLQLIGIGTAIVYSFVMAKFTLFFLQSRKESQQITP